MFAGDLFTAVVCLVWFGLPSHVNVESNSNSVHLVCFLDGQERATPAFHCVMATVHWSSASSVRDTCKKA